MFKTWFLPTLTALFLATAFGVSLFFEGAQSVAYAPALGCLLTGFLVAVLPGVWKGLSLPKGMPALWLLGLWIYVTISLLWSTTPFPSLITYLIFCMLPLGFFALSMAPGRQAFIEASGYALHAALTLFGLWAVLQVTVFHDRFPGRAGYPLLDPNNLAALMNMGLLPTLAVCLTASKGWRLYASALSALILAGGLAATESRAGFLCFGLGVLFLLIVLRPKAGRLGMLALSIVLIFIGLGFYSVTGGSAGRIASLVHFTSDDAAMNRLVLWHATIGMIMERPLTGTGLGSFYLAYPSHRPIADQWSAGQWAHNDPLQFAAEMGVAAMILLYGFLFSLFRRSMTALRAGATQDQKAAIVGPLAAFMAMILHAHVEFQLYVMPVLIVGGVWLAAWYDRTAALLPEPASWSALILKSWQRAVGGLVIAGMILLLAVPALRCAMATHYLVIAIHEMQKSKPKTFATLLDKADAWGPPSFIDARIQRAGLYIDLLRTPVGLFTRSDQQAMAHEVLTSLNIAEKTVPYWSEVDDKRAALYMAMKERLDPEWRKKAEESLKTALKKNPLDIKARGRLIEMTMQNGDVETAYALLQDGLARPHDVADDADMKALAARLQMMIAAKRRYEERKKP